MDSESIALIGIKRRFIPSKYDVTCDQCQGHGSQCDQVAAAQRVGKADECWDTSHAFLVIMGGFHFHNKDGPLYPLSPANVLELVRRGHLVPPTADEISDKSKGDATRYPKALLLPRRCGCYPLADTVTGARLPYDDASLTETASYGNDTRLTGSRLADMWDAKGIGGMNEDPVDYAHTSADNGYAAASPRVDVFPYAYAPTPVSLRLSIALAPRRAILDHRPGSQRPAVVEDTTVAANMRDEAPRRATTSPNEAVPEYTSIWDQILTGIIGNQDSYVDLRKCQRVPTFWAGNADGTIFLIADATALVVAMMFGAVHCIAWYSEFQSHLEQQLWRWSAITIIAVPVALVIVFFAAALVDSGVDWNAIDMITSAIYNPIAVIYVVARLVLIILSFTSLKGLPFGAYQNVQWTTFIPHI
ncbi:hypothetical protein FIBSPDRAFT_1053661 [Athelia psychrophila]|uniref:Uncharacterized protein n=1 Tax=Athelia psychrophila TaxID=1759441 RepID=A0A167WKE4_9AGAM|nr:hypothetical protein FIBSPDRAFT_1053661 [Fibularhizoctonia sp. CBS 109695]